MCLDLMAWIKVLSPPSLLLMVQGCAQLMNSIDLANDVAVAGALSLSVPSYSLDTVLEHHRETHADIEAQRNRCDTHPVVLTACSVGKTCEFARSISTGHFAATEVAPATTVL